MLANLVFDFFLRGGAMMWPMLVCLLAALFVILERAFWWWELQCRSQPDTLVEMSLFSQTSG